MDNLKVEVPEEVAKPCPLPDIPSEEDAGDILKVYDFSLGQEAGIACERIRKKAALSIVSHMNNAVDDLKRDLEEAIRSSRIRTGPFSLW